MLYYVILPVATSPKTFVSRWHFLGVGFYFSVGSICIEVL
ncbi:hypothetical protein AEQU3_03198 [Aequorivita antarctica]|nr:hypothetical protein AEQU3_03198 [Aequorivita antarctica]